MKSLAGRLSLWLTELVLGVPVVVKVMGIALGMALLLAAGMLWQIHQSWHVDFTLYSPYAGRVEVHYSPGSVLRAATQREIRVRTGVDGPALLQIKRLDPETDGRQKGK